MLTVINEFNQECLTTVVARRLRLDDMLQVLADLFIESGSPRENGYNERASTASCATSCWTGRSSARSARPRS